MKLNKIYFIEKFAIVTFPIALAVGCTSTADQENKYVTDTSHVVNVDQRNDILEENIPGTLQTSTAIDIERNETTLAPDSVKDVDIAGNSPSNEDSQVLGGNDLLYTKHSLTNSEVTINKSEMPNKGIFHFAINNYGVAETDHQILQQHANYLKENINMILYVDGFSDNRGPAHLNYLLSKRRAQQIASLLIEYGAPESRMKVSAYGESFPLTDENNWDENRRVELEYKFIDSSNEVFANLK